MKKLMTTMLAVAVGVSLHAVGMASTGTSFEGLDAGDYDINATTGELSAQEAGQTYWVTNGTDQTLTVVAGSSVATTWDNNPGVPTRPFSSGPQQKYLDIKTTLGKPVTRNVSVGGVGTEIGDGFYFDSLVKFTAFDGDQTVNLDGGKLAIWLKEVYGNGDSAEPTSTNLVITAGYLLNNSAVVTNYSCNVTGVNLNDGGWHRVTVKAIGSIYSGNDVPGFVVYVDGVYATSTAAKGIDTSALNDNAFAFNSDGALFPSADQSSGAMSEISSVAFDGQGSVDDLMFTATAPAFAKDNEFFTIELGANVASLTYSVYGMGLSTTITETTRLAYVPDMGITVTGVTCSNGYMTAGITTSASVTLTDGYYFPGAAEQSITANAKLAGAAINGTPYETAAAAFAAITAGTAGAGPFTVTLATAATSGVELDAADAVVVLDLAGNNISAADGDAAAITLMDGTLLVTNSTVTVGEVNGYNGGSALVTAGGTLTIAGGIYNGAVDVSSATSLITGGSFSVNDNKDSESVTVPPAPNTDLAKAVMDGYELEVVSGSSYYTLVEAAAPQPVVAEHPWYDSANNGGPAAVVLAENLPGQTGNIVSAFHGQGEGEYLGLTYSTNPLQFDLYQVDGTNALTTLRQIPVGETGAGFRGVAISKSLGIAVTLAYATTTTMYAYPLTGGDPTVVSKPSTHAFDAGAFSPDGKYFFSNAIEGEGSKSPAVLKWSVSMENGVVTLTKIGVINASGRNRFIAYSRINGRDLVFALVDASSAGAISVIDMTGDDTSAWTARDLITGLPVSSYGTLCVSGVNVVDSQGNPATPHLTVATSSNNGATKGDVLNVYALTVPATGAVSASLIRSFDEDALTAFGFGDISDANRYGNTVYVTDDEATIYFARPDNKLYAAQYAKYYAVEFVSGEGATTNTLSVAEGRLPTAPEAAEVTGKSFSAWTPTVVPAAADATYTALYTNNIYTITFVIGESSSSVQKEYGSEITSVPEPPVVPGYTGAWDDDPAGDTVTGDKTYTYTYSAETYTIAYMYDGNALTGLTPAAYTVEDAVTLPSEVDLGVVGVSFAAWTNELGQTVASWSAGDKTGNQTFYAQTAAVVPTAIDPEGGTVEVTVSAVSEEAAIAGVLVTPPTGSGADAAEYKALFNFTAVETSSGSGEYTVTLTGIKDEVVTGVDTSAVALLTGSASEGTITVPAGLYYRITPSTALPISGTPVSGLSTGASETVTKPGTTKGFYKIELSATPFAQE